jgi:homoserine kinase type II
LAVHTDVTDDELKAFVADYELGEVLSFQGIAEGVENSNFAVRTSRGSFILTLYEKRVAAADLPFFLTLMEHLAARGVSCPTPLKTRTGEALRTLRDRPAAMVTFLEGLWPRRITVTHCLQVGRALAELHRAGADFPMRRANALSVAGWGPLLEATRAEADGIRPGLAAALDAEYRELAARWPTGLPTGVIHADLFPDNVFFLGDRLSGLIDFYFACTDALSYDLAVCLNAWCFEADRSLNVTKARALFQGYEAVRPLEPAERQALPLLARGSALRFLLTRLYDWLNHVPDAFVIRKDPLEYWAKLRFHQSVGDCAAYGLA